MGFIGRSVRWCENLREATATVFCFFVFFLISSHNRLSFLLKQLKVTVNVFFCSACDACCAHSSGNLFHKDKKDLQNCTSSWWTEVNLLSTCMEVFYCISARLSTSLELLTVIFLTTMFYKAVQLKPLKDINSTAVCP